MEVGVAPESRSIGEPLLAAALERAHASMVGSGAATPATCLTGRLGVFAEEIVKRMVEQEADAARAGCRAGMCRPAN